MKRRGPKLTPIEALKRDVARVQGETRAEAEGEPVIRFQLRDDVDDLAAMEALRARFKGLTVRGEFCSVTFHCDRTISVRPKSKKDRARARWGLLADEIDFLLAEHDDLDLVLARGDMRIGRAVNLYATDLRSIAKVLHRVAAGEDPAKALGLAYERRGAPRSATRAAQWLEIALDVHQRPPEERSNQRVADDHACDPGTVEAAVAAFEGFLKDFVAP